MPTWMVVEDEPDIYDVLLAMFEIWGIEGIAFVDGGEAMAWIDDVDQGFATELPELCILDIRLPEVSDPEIGARIRQSKYLRNVAIVLITAYRMTSTEEANARLAAGSDMLLYKPLPAMPELGRIFHDVVDRRKS